MNIICLTRQWIPCDTGKINESQIVSNVMLVHGQIDRTVADTDPLAGDLRGQASDFIGDLGQISNPLFFCVTNAAPNGCILFTMSSLHAKLEWTASAYVLCSR